MSVLSLVKSAFGHTCLYKSLDVSPSSNSDQLKRAYRRAALKYHPDRASNFAANNPNEAVISSTLKFQAVSAAYQILMDDTKRSVYDSSGRIPDGDFYEEENVNDTPSAGKYARNQTHSNDQWESFFYSIFHEMISAKTSHDADAKSYRGSSSEHSDVLKYYNICKGDWTKIAECVAFGDKADVQRWKRDVIGPATLRGEVPDFDCKDDTTSPEAKRKAVSLEDSSSSEDYEHVVVKNKTRQVVAKRKQISLEDSSSSEDDVQIDLSKKRRLRKKTSITSTKTQINVTRTSQAQSSMSKRDKLEYRKAKKQKDKKLKELEVAELFQSTDWGGTFSVNGNTKGRNNAGSLNNKLLDNIERKYARSNRQTK
jgi:curved DNA-binding protein CbpA